MEACGGGWNHGSPVHAHPAEHWRFGGRRRRRPLAARQRARQDSNLRLPAPEAGALSTELRAPRDQLNPSFLNCAIRTHVLSGRGPSVRVVQTATKGNAAEAAVLNAFVERDFDVLVPFGEGQPYDLVVHPPINTFLRVQCKTARQRDGCLVFNSRTTDHGRGRLTYVGVADIFGVYFAPSQWSTLCQFSKCRASSLGCVSSPLATISGAVSGSPPTTRSIAGQSKHSARSTGWRCTRLRPALYPTELRAPRASV
jgi:PD-(D/E)XK endonuclease